MRTMQSTATDATLRLPDGKTIAYAEYGDPSGKPVLLMHGFPDARVTRYPDDTLTASLGVRLIVMDRPGIGGSDLIPARSLYERAALAGPLADRLKIERFAVLGWSAGGAYALACAHRLAGRVTAAGIACGFAPFDRPDALDGMNQEMRRMIPMAKRLPFLLSPFMSLAAREYRKDPRKALDKQFAGGVSDADRAVMARPAIGENLLAGAREAMRQGGAGPALEVKLQFGRPWGFRLEDIQTPVRLWYGDADKIVPMQMGRYLQQTIPNATLTLCEGEGHTLFYTRWEEMLRAITA